MTYMNTNDRAPNSKIHGNIVALPSPPKNIAGDLILIGTVVCMKGKVNSCSVHCFPAEMSSMLLLAFLHFGYVLCIATWGVNSTAGRLFMVGK